MPSTLGKRARTITTDEDTSRSSRIKRRAQIIVTNDENVDPDTLQHAQDPCGQGLVDLHELHCSSHRPLLPSPARSTSRSRRIALSPRKANGQEKSYEGPPSDDVAQLPTPKTPRHRDALSKRLPVTPRHRVGLVGKPLTPRTPQTSSVLKQTPTVYQRARQLFTQSADPGPLVEREEERRELQSFVDKGIRSRRGRCLYVSGPPGTGKSALVNEVCRNLDSAQKVKVASINCMSVKCRKDIFSKLIEDLVGNDVFTVVDELTCLRDIFLPTTTSSTSILYIVTLDEIDHLLTLDLEILYTLFEWSLHHSSRLIVIGIANALDLTDRFLPRLKARNLKPQLLPFLPYTAPQIASVITTKLRSLSSSESTPRDDYVPVLQQAAIQLCSKKVAAQTGDLRKAFDIIRRTIDLIETETKQNLQQKHADQRLPSSPCKIPLGENPNLRSPPQVKSTFNASLEALTSNTAPRATIAHVSRISAAALSNGTSQRLQTLNLQQKAALCALLSYQRSSRKAASSIFTSPSKPSGTPSVKEVYQVYCKLCKREDALRPLISTEFVDIVSSLETLGLIGEDRCHRGISAAPGTLSRKSKGIPEEKRILCYVNEDELNRCLGGVGREILTGLLAFDA